MSNRSPSDVDVFADIMASFFVGSRSFTSEELQAELEHYARLMGVDAPHSTAIGKRLAALGYVKTDRKPGLSGKKVSVYKHNLKAVKRA